MSRNALIEKVLLGAIYGDENPNLQTPLDLGTQEYADPAGAARSLVLKGAAHMDSKTADIMRAEDYPRGPILAKGYGSFGNYLLKAGYILVNKEGRFSMNPAKKF